MFDFSWSEILLIGVVALVVIGPKDLPRVLRTAGQWMSRARAVARDFQVQVDQLVRESELQDVRQHLTDAASLDPKRMIGNWLDPDGELAKSVSEPELFGETPAMPAEEPTATIDPTIEPELPLLAPQPHSTPAPDLEPAHAAPAPEPVPAARPDPTPEPEAAAPAEVKSGTHG